MTNSKTLSAIVTIFCVTAIVGCSPQYEGNKRWEISGAATFGGQPIVEGSIDMAPVDHDGNRVSGMIENGAYHFAEEDGPTLGKYRIEIYGFQAVGGGTTGGGDEDAEAEEANLRQVVPAQFNKQTTLEIEIVDGENVHDFNLVP